VLQINAGGTLELTGPVLNAASTTFTDNLTHVRAAIPELLADGPAGLVLSRIDGVSAALAEAPKSMRWRARSVVGRKTPWYELPEEVDRGAAR